MDLENANETDIREEIASPLLTLLGYKRNSPNDILREESLKYDRIFLGRKKNNDPPLKGRADYILSVTGAGRWAFEIKGPNIELTVDDFEQAISYARHPEVAANYAAITNGHKFIIFHSSQRSNETPLVELQINSVEELATKLSGILGPAAIRRDCAPPAIDLERPLAPGLRSFANIIGGVLVYEYFDWKSSIPLGSQEQSIAQTVNRLVGTRETITGGRVYRDEKSRIVANIQWAVGREELFQFITDKGLVNFDYVSLNPEISTNSEYPSTFDVVGDIQIYEGEQVFDMMSWSSKTMGLDSNMTLRGQGTGYISGNVFSGAFQSEYEVTFPPAPHLTINMFGGGTFSVKLDDR
ncbi:MAG: type I restriction enzyme HsdR N-terminal domain-containing protein [Methylocystaceae bacterium]|nr:type I restriction enzyme HsdR N-terminal domain-containing protein [Methylocystaceae bacterium]